MEQLRSHLRSKKGGAMKKDDFFALLNEVDKYLRAKVALEEVADGNPQFYKDYARIMKKELRLGENNRFRAFLADIFVNTSPTKSATDSEISQKVVSPVLDRFVTLAMTLSDPSIIKTNP